MSVSFGEGARRVLRSGDPKGDDFRNAHEWVRDIRSLLVGIRGELEDIGKIEASFPHDRLCNKVAGSLTLALIALHRLVEGDRSFVARANNSDGLWADVAANPSRYIIEDGSTWDWRPNGIFVRRDRRAGGSPGTTPPFVLSLLWTCQTCGWNTTVDAPGFGGDGRFHYEQPGNRPCGPITAQRAI